MLLIDSCIFIEYQLKIFKNWILQAENKKLDEVFNIVYENLKFMIKNADISENKKVIYLNNLKDLKKIYH